MLAAVTGANGYLGSRIAAALRGAGWRVDKLTRSGADAVPYSLGSGPPDGYFQDSGVDALVHCAWDFSLVTESDIWRDNVRGSLRLLEQAQRAGTRVVFISTISAFPGCRSLYGKAKLAVEKRVMELGGTVVRPGLVFGDLPGGIVGAMVKAAEKLPVLPLIGRGRQILYPCHENDLTALIVHLAAPQPAPGSPVVAAGEHGASLREIVGLLLGPQRPLRVLPVPWRAAWAGLRLAEAVGVRSGFRSDSVLSLVHQDPSPDFSSRKAFPVVFRDFSSLLGARQRA
jgi:nucleoside-diphosphate-sugar epimerase